MKSQRSGMSLMEVVVSCTLLAILLPLLFNLFPSSLRALKRSGVQQTEASIAAYRMDEAALLPHLAASTVALPDVVLDGRKYSIYRSFYALDPDIYRLDAAVTVQTEGYPGYTVQSRFGRDSAP